MQKLIVGISRMRGLRAHGIEEALALRYCHHPTRRNFPISRFPPTCDAAGTPRVDLQRNLATDSCRRLQFVNIYWMAKESPNVTSRHVVIVTNSRTDPISKIFSKASNNQEW